MALRKIGDEIRLSRGRRVYYHQIKKLPPALSKCGRYGRAVVSRFQKATPEDSLRGHELKRSMTQ